MPTIEEWDQILQGLGTLNRRIEGLSVWTLADLGSQNRMIHWVAAPEGDCRPDSLLFSTRYTSPEGWPKPYSRTIPLRAAHETVNQKIFIETLTNRALLAIEKQEKLLEIGGPLTEQEKREFGEMLHEMQAYRLQHEILQQQLRIPRKRGHREPKPALEPKRGRGRPRKLVTSFSGSTS